MSACRHDAQRKLSAAREKSVVDLKSDLGGLTCASLLNSRRCIDAPSEDLHLWELVGDPGKRNGGKLLRGKLIALPQWTDVQTRHDTVR